MNWTTLLFLLCLLYPEANSNAYPQSEWRTYIDKSGHYSIQLPSGGDSPEYFPLDLPLGPWGKAKAGHRHLAFEMGREDTTYLLDYYDLTPEDLQRGPDRIVKQLMHFVGTSCKPSLVSNDKWLDCKWQTDEEQALSRIYLTSNRIYMLSVMWPQGASTPDKAERFFESFKLKGQ